jgi:hypothetical protein
MGNRRGLSGISALIVMIAIMISAFVIGVSIFNATRVLFISQETTAKEKESGIANPIVIETVRARDLEGRRKLDMIVAVVRLRHGDDAISFNDTIIIPNTKAINCSSINYGVGAKPGCAYDIEYLKMGGRWRHDWLSPGDVVEMKYSGEGLLKDVEDFSARFIFVPPTGVTTTISFDIPERVYPANIHLWPLR